MGRGKQYGRKESKLLALAWIKASTNAAVGTAQRSSTMWESVHEKFVALSPDNYPPGTYKDREVSAIKNHLTKHVFPSVNKFSECLTRVNAANLTGGLSDLEKINIAVSIHVGKVKEPLYNYRGFESKVHWPYFSAWYDVLRLEPKWQPTGIGRTSVDSSNTSGSNSNDDNVVGEQGTGNTESDPDQVNILASMPSRKRGGHPGRAQAKKKLIKEKHDSGKIETAKQFNASLGALQANLDLTTKIKNLKGLIKMTKNCDDGLHEHAKAELKKLYLQGLTLPTPVITFTESTSDSEQDDLSDDIPVIQI
jgi:hypothetical protein